MNCLQGKVAVITGAARGIGRAIAVAYAREGAAIMGIDKAAEVSPTTAYPVATPADLTETQRLVEAEGDYFIPHQLDSRGLPALRAAAERAAQELGPVDVLVANVGIQVFAPLLDMSNAQWHDVLDTNLMGTANTVRAFAPAMSARQQASIIVTPSGQGKKGFRHGASYAASKWGIIGFPKSAALDLGQCHIRVNALVPGLVATDMTMNETRLQEACQAYRSDPPTPSTLEDAAVVRGPRTAVRLPWPEAADMAPIVVFPGSDEARHISGASFDVDAGDSAQFTA